MVLNNYIVAYRAFPIDLVSMTIGSRGTGGNSITRPHFRTLWPIKAPLVAECISPTYSSANLFRPDSNISGCIGYVSKDCTCGVYGIRETLLPEAPLLLPYGHVVGRVALWGKVQEHAFGYRSEFAYPLTFEYKSCATCGFLLTTPSAICSTCSSIRDLYSIAVRFRDLIEEGWEKTLGVVSHVAEKYGIEAPLLNQGGQRYEFFYRNYAENLNGT